MVWSPWRVTVSLPPLRTAGCPASGACPTHPQQLLFALLLHKHLFQLLVEPFQAPVQAGAESQDR